MKKKGSSEEEGKEKEEGREREDRNFSAQNRKIGRRKSVVTAAASAVPGMSGAAVLGPLACCYGLFRFDFPLFRSSDF